MCDFSPTLEVNLRQSWHNSAKEAPKVAAQAKAKDEIAALLGAT